MNDLHNTYSRIQEYFRLMSNDFERGFIIDEDYYIGIPISRISSLLNLPVDLIRKDIVGIRSWRDILCFDDDICEELSKKLNTALDEDNLDKNTSVFDEMLLHGEFDEVPIYIYTNSDARYYISLTEDEAHAYHQFTGKHSTHRTSTAAYHIKDSYRYHFIDKLNEKLDVINSAINNGFSIRIDYQPAHEERLQTTIRPLKIAYDSVDNVYAILTIIEDMVHIYRLDRIISIEKSRIHISIPDTSILNIAPNVWGYQFSATPYNVKVRFYNEGNVWNKVRSDLSCRTNGTLYVKNGYLYYEDVVYGINSFKNWIYGYGSSAIVLKPQELREDIIASLKSR